MSRLLIFTVLVSFVLVYFGLRLAPAFGTAAWVGAAALIALLFVYPLTWRWRDSEAAPAKFLRWFIFFDMGFISLMLSFLIFRDIVFLPFTWWRPELTEPLFGGVSSGALILVSLIGLAFGLARALGGPRIKRVEVPIQGLSEVLRGYTIAQISDLHVGPTISKAYVEDVVRKVRELKPRLIVLTGDIADGDHKTFGEAVKPLGELQALAPVFYVPGNHEYYWNAPRWIQEFESLGMKALLNGNEVLEVGGAKVMIAGVVDPTVRITDPKAKPDAEIAMRSSAGSVALKVLLSHHPGLARTAAALGYDLQLSGHTHAGQFFPWTLVVPRVHEFSNGLKAAGRMWVYVNPGTGSWGPPIRIGTTPEITLLTLVPP